MDLPKHMRWGSMNMKCLPDIVSQLTKLLGNIMLEITTAVAAPVIGELWAGIELHGV